MNKLLILLVAVILCVIAYFFSVLLEQPRQFNAQKPPPVIETYIEGADMQQFSPEGKIKNQLLSPLTTKMTDSASINMLEPRSSVYLKKAWEITADEGLYDTATDVFSAIGHVLIKRTDGIVQIQTSRLNYNVDTHIVSTKQPVYLKTPQGNIRAVGLTADLDKETLELHQNIESSYESLRH